MSITEATAATQAESTTITIDGDLILAARAELDRVRIALEKSHQHDTDSTRSLFLGRAIEGLDAADEAVFSAMNTCSAFLKLDGTRVAMTHSSDVDCEPRELLARGRRADRVVA